MPEEPYNPYLQDSSSPDRPELSAKPTDKRLMIIGAVTAIVLILLFLGIGWLLFINPEATAILRDIFIIYMGLGIFIIILLLIVLIVLTGYLVLKVNDLVQLLNREVRPVLSNIQETLGTVRGTTSFISEQAVSPVITTVSSVTAAKAVVRSLFRRD